MYDLTITATLRPKLVERCLAGIQANVSQEPANVFVNIDPAGNGGTQRNVAAVVQRFYPGAVIWTPNEPSFPLAVKWLWESARSPAILHIEDSKEINQPVDVDWLLAALNDLAAVSLKFCKLESAFSDQSCPEKPKRRPDELWETPYYGNAVCMQPTMWRREVAATLACWMKHGVSPEKTIRPGPMNRNPDRVAVIEYMQQFRFGFVTNKPNVFWYHRHGTSWRRKAGYRKKPKKGIPDTWMKS